MKNLKSLVILQLCVVVLLTVIGSCVGLQKGNKISGFFQENSQYISAETVLSKLDKKLNNIYKNARFPVHPYFSNKRDGSKTHFHRDAANCKEKYFTEQIVDHFDAIPPPLNTTHFSQRYFICDGYWSKSPNAPIFFYTGNEADVELYVNHTGLMYESAPQFGALLVFVEHRYFGKTQPFGKNTPKYMNYLSLEQALADYSHFLWWFKSTINVQNPPIIGFGGSYGGMLSSWFRMKYPGIIDGAISGSAPILAFLYLDPPYDVNSFQTIETQDAMPQSGASAACAPNVRQSFQYLFTLGATDAGRKQITSAFQLCAPLENTNDVYVLASWLKSGWDFMSMGNYPYPTDYITNGHGVLPAFPMIVACNFLNKTAEPVTTLFENVREGVAVFYNVSGDASCFDINQSVNNDTLLDGLYWDYLFCTGIFMPSAQNGVTDMFWNEPFDMQAQVNNCKQQWNVDTPVSWIPETYGGYAGLRASSNIFFSNGILDPWHGGGVLQNMSSSVVASLMSGAAHHLDLMFSNPLDPQSVLQTRQAERYFIQQWINEKMLKNDDQIN